MRRLTAEQLVAELASGNFWRRQTARRLLTERREAAAADSIRRLIAPSSRPAVQLNALYTLAALEPIELGRRAGRDGRRRRGSPHPRACDWPRPGLAATRPSWTGPWRLPPMTTSTVQMQAALTLGESRDQRVVPALARLRARAWKCTLDGRGDFEFRRQTRWPTA